jgi:hypothetical protein
VDPATIALILQYGLKYGPEAIKVVRRLFSKKEPTDADWDELDGILSKTGASYFGPVFHPVPFTVTTTGTIP